MRILVLGISGMLGQEVYRSVKKHFPYVTVGTNRQAEFKSATNERVLKFHAHDDITKILEKYEFTHVINCIGVIKPQIFEDKLESVYNAFYVNSVFSRNLSDICRKKAIRLYQIQTDCVYNGVKGGYDEDAKFSPIDIYGMSKLFGETTNDSTTNLRCSIVGKEIYSKKSLLEWAINQDSNSEINGFTNHIWNGISTRAFTKVLIGMIREDYIIPNRIQHLVPADIVNKATLLKIILNHFGRNDVVVNKIKTQEKIDRSLITKYENENLKLWKLAGYNHIPSIREIIEEIPL